MADSDDVIPPSPPSSSASGSQHNISLRFPPLPQLSSTDVEHDLSRVSSNQTSDRTDPNAFRRPDLVGGMEFMAATTTDEGALYPNYDVPIAADDTNNDSSASSQDYATNANVLRTFTAYPDTDSDVDSIESISDIHSMNSIVESQFDVHSDIHSMNSEPNSDVQSVEEISDNEEVEVVHVVTDDDDDDGVDLDDMNRSDDDVEIITPDNNNAIHGSARTSVADIEDGDVTITEHIPSSSARAAVVNLLSSHVVAPSSSHAVAGTSSSGQWTNTQRSLTEAQQTTTSTPAQAIPLSSTPPQHPTAVPASPNPVSDTPPQHQTAVPASLNPVSHTPPQHQTAVPASLNPVSHTPPQHQTAVPASLNPVVSLIRAQGTSPGEFRRYPKRKRVVSPVKSLSSVGTVSVDDEDCCPICFEAWTTSGTHRLSSLKCGHLFGQSCIQKWLQGHGGKCPQCNAKAKKNDIRVLYAKSIKAVDTTERDRALKDLEMERERRHKTDMESAQFRLQFQMAVEESNKLKLELENLRAQMQTNPAGVVVPGSSGIRTPAVQPSSSIQSTNKGHFFLDKSIKISEAGHCRVMAYSPSMATLVVSQPSSSPLFPGFGVRKISTLDFKTCQYLTIHSKAIRDLAFHAAIDAGMVLSCGLDKKVKLTSLLSNTVVQSYETQMPAWSCVWNPQNHNYFYAGLQNGTVLEFDIRNIESPVKELNQGTRSPVASLCYLPSDMGATFRPGGLLVGQLDRVSFYEHLPDKQHKLHLLPTSGMLTSLHIEEQTRHFLVSYRPSGDHSTIRHQLCEMFSRNVSNDPTVIDNICSCNVIHTFIGGRAQTVLSKTRLIRSPANQNRLLVCAGDETNNSVHIWDSGSLNLTERLPTGGIPVDICSFNINNTAYLTALTDKSCKVYKWSNT